MYWTSPKKYLLQALEPIHVGSGESSIGAVDNVIYREEATGLPGIPGTSLSGAIKSCCELQAAAGQGVTVEEVNDYFGTALGDQGSQGILKFSDARLLFFPVPTVYGPVWVTEYTIASEYLGVTTPLAEGQWAQPLHSTWAAIPSDIAAADRNRINLGWIYLDLADGATNQAPESSGSTTRRASASLDLADGATNQAPVHGGPSENLLTTIYKRALLVHPLLFKHLCNDHLEVRTSVAIDDNTGAAEEGLLFTYEAIPRGAVLVCNIAALTRDGHSNCTLERAQALVDSTQTLMKVWGIGGMITRGFGSVNMVELA